jgi:beta-glucanase (GH16 family)
MLLICLITLFAGYPIITHFTEDKQSNNGAYNMGGINSTGQVPYIPNFPQLIDPDTPSDVMSRTGFDGNNYELVFSDEFNKDGRTFYEGDDPFWQAV